MVYLLIIVICLVISYIVLLHKQLISIKEQLDNRIVENTRQRVTIQLHGRKLSSLAKSINRTLKAEENLRLESLRREKEFRELIANISHDLRTPLTAIKGYQQLIEGTELSTTQQKKLNIAQKHADDLGRLIEHFFEYSYLLNTESEPSLEKINLTNLVTECIAEYINILEKKKLSIIFADSLPVFVNVDREMTERILANLIKNCIEHSKGVIHVSVTNNKENKAIIMFENSIVENNQIDVKRLFDRFYTADNTREKMTGLGLAIVRILAEKMGGSVSGSIKENKLQVCVMFPAINQYE